MTENQTVAILSPGDMGHSVGQVLVDGGLRVITCLRGRSARTRALAAQAHIEDVPTYPDLVSEADVLLSILVPAQAVHAAQAVAQALVQTGTELLYADCNAISPQTTRQVGALISQAGGRFVDASIVGGPPRGDRGPRFYVAGPHAGAFEALGHFGLHVVVLGEQIGLASAIKMCYGAWTKGSTALLVELLTAATALGVYEALESEFQGSQPALVQRMRGLSRVPVKSRRFVGEMTEIASTFEGVGLTPQILAGAADMYRMVGDTPLADRTPEDTSPLPSLEEMLSILAQHLPDVAS